MTRDQMADFICGKVNQTETEDLAACRAFLQRRHEMIWADQLWKDSLVEYRQTLSPTGYTAASNWLPTKGVLLLPPGIQRVIAARTDTRKLNVQRPEFFHRIDYDAFAKSGDATDYILLPPCVWELDAGYNLLVTSSNDADSNQTVFYDILDADGVGVTRVTYPLATANTFFPSSNVERVDYFSKPATAGTIGMVASLYLTTGWSLKNTSGSTQGFRANITADLATATDFSVAAGATSNMIDSSYNFLWAVEYTESGAVALAGPFTIPTGIYTSGYGAKFKGAIAWNGAAFSLEPDVQIASLGPTETVAKRRQRLRLVEIPTAATTIRVLGKRSVPTLDASDEPAIQSSENCLIAFAQGDMLQRERQYAKATALFQEGALLLEQLKRVETVQQAHNSRMIPETGYGADYQGIDSKAGMF